YKAFLYVIDFTCALDFGEPQDLMRHANCNITMNIYTHAVSSKKRRAQQKVVEMILPEGKNAVATKGVA
ncbi:MAG: hypothetical protein WA714_17850, partial [Candidatus Acidiferrales bacterium]